MNLLKQTAILRIRTRARDSSCGMNHPNSGVILSAKALIDRTPKPTDEQIQQALSGVLCRCFTHQRMIAAVKRYANGGAA